MSSEFLRIAAVTTLLLAAPVSHSVSITNVFITNNSSAEEVDTLASGRLEEFHTASSIGSAITGTDSIELTTQMQWYNGYKGSGASLRFTNVTWSMTSSSRCLTPPTADTRSLWTA